MILLDKRTYIVIFVISMVCLAFAIVLDAFLVRYIYPLLYVASAFLLTTMLWIYINNKNPDQGQGLNLPPEDDQEAPQALTTRVIDLDKLSLDERRKIAKLIAEEAYHQFLTSNDLSGYEIDVEEYEYASGRKKTSKVVIKPPKTSLVTVPSYVRRRKAPISPAKDAGIKEEKPLSTAVTINPISVTISTPPACKPAPEKTTPIAAPSANTMEVFGKKIVIPENLMPIPAPEDEEEPAASPVAPPDVPEDEEDEDLPEIDDDLRKQLKEIDEADDDFDDVDEEDADDDGIF
jgi:hypothetical protein